MCCVRLVWHNVFVYMFACVHVCIIIIIHSIFYILSDYIPYGERNVLT